MHTYSNLSPFTASGTPNRADPLLQLLPARYLRRPQPRDQQICHASSQRREVNATMGKAYNQDQRDRVKLLLEAGRDEETIEKDTGVSDRTIRRWKMELERTGRIGKPPESRTGRHRVLNAEVEAVGFEDSKSVRALD